MRTQSHFLEAAYLKKPVDEAIVRGPVSPVR
jgi:hypothetical protein